MPPRLFDAITGGDCVAFIGAGFTAPVVPGAYLRVLRPKRHRWWHRQFCEKGARAAVMQPHGSVDEPDQAHPP